MKLLITGSSGFVGQNLLSYLGRNKSYLFDHLKRDELYVVDEERLSSNNVVIHLAGKAHDLKKTSQPQDYYDVNFELTKKLYDAFLASASSKFIFISSVKAAADTVDGILKEDVIAAPLTHYGKSKLMAEEYIKNQDLPEGKSFYILRPCMIHGKGNKGNLNLLFHFVKKGIPYPLAGFNNKRSFLAIENLCFIIKKLITTPSIPSGIYNVADDVSLSTNEVVIILAESTAKKAKLWKIPKSIVEFIAKIGDVLHLPLTTERLNKLTENYVVSNGKIKKALGVDLPLSVREGLEQTAKSFFNN